MWSLDSRVPKSFLKGTHRTAAPEATLARARALMPLVGVTRVSDVTGLDCIGVPVAMAIRPNARSLAVSPGKGLDLTAAKTSALMEAIESWHAERILLPLLLARVNEIHYRRAVVDLSRLPRRAAGELREETSLLWIEGVDLMNGTSKWLPYEVVHTNFTLPLPTASGAFLASSNGLASGNHPLEAIGHALSEVIERDATTLWHALGERERDDTLIDLASVDDEDCMHVLELFEAASVKVGVWDLTSDVGIPAFRCVVLDAQPGLGRPHLPGVGAGCHPCRAIALLRALTEAAQTRITLIAGARDDLGVAFYVRANDSGIHERTLQRLDSTKAKRDFRSIVDWPSDSLDGDLQTLLAGLKRVGVEEAVAIELSKPEIGIPVVRVVVPGLEGIHEAPGYLGGERYQRKLSARQP